jgi:hypothetical protein
MGYAFIGGWSVNSIIILNMRRFIMNFSTKKSGFFWTDINPCVREAEYAVRGIVPTLANAMQE